MYIRSILILSSHLRIFTARRLFLWGLSIGSACAFLVSLMYATSLEDDNKNSCLLCQRKI
jgi:hypothetical protein